MANMDEIYANIDRFFENNQPKEAEKYMLQVLETAIAKGDRGLCLQLQNELIGYYRQTSEYEKLTKMIEQALTLARELGLEGSIPYATTLLNAATGLRSMGAYERALSLYGQVEEIYQNLMPVDDLRLAGFFNNKSLLYQELRQYEEAYACQKKALEIALSQDSAFEIGVSYANLANTCVSLRQIDEAKEFAGKSMKIFEKYELLDPHYAAALSALGLCFYQEGNKKAAAELFQRGMEIIQKCVGKNAQYARLEELYRMCAEVKEQTGLELCRMYYEAYGKPMLEEQFPEYLDKIAVGLVGEGSDCFRFDDEVSRDHDWGPGFCLWVTEETYAQIGERLLQAYDALPKEFMGYTRKDTAAGEKRLGVMTISDFYKQFLQTNRVEAIDYALVEDYALATACNGAVFRDDDGVFSGIREALLQGYPEKIYYLKLAEGVAKISQCGQYNFERMWKRKEFVTAESMVYDCIRESLKLYHILCNVYPPHDKWLMTSVKRLDGGRTIAQFCEELRKVLHQDNEDTCKQVTVLVEKLCAYLADALYQVHAISDVDAFLGAHIDELLKKADLANCTDEELVDKIVQLEFKAFDLVKNEGGRASCQNDWPTFSIMRKSQYLTWNRTMLLQYFYDFEREFLKGHNLITEKYGRMMESTASARYEEIKEHFPELSEQKKAVIEQIVAVQMEMMEEFAKVHPSVASNARTLHTYEDSVIDTSYETYLRGEISTYSDKMLQLYGSYVVEKAANGQNIARLTIENTAKLYGFDSLEKFEKMMGY